MIGVVSGVLVLDQFTKWIVRTNFHEGQTLPVLGDVFHLTYYHNTGMAFGMMQGFSGWIALFSVLAIAALIFLSRQWREEDGVSPRSIDLSLGMVIGGACGNLIDRLTLSSVVDFLDFGLADYRWPAFNVADVCISVGVGLLVFFTTRRPEHAS